MRRLSTVGTGTIRGTPRDRSAGALRQPSSGEGAEVTTNLPSSTQDPSKPVRSGGMTFRGALLVLVPPAWVPVALLHPGGGDAFAELHDKVGVWLVVHLAELVLSLALAAVFWTLIGGGPDQQSPFARVSLPIYLVFFTAFDAVAGIATGLAVHHANGLAGQERVGAASTADYLLDNRVAGSFSVMGFVASVALVVVVVAVAMVLRSAGSSLWTFGLMLLGVLLVAHSGLPAAVGLAGISASVLLSEREGLVTGLPAGGRRQCRGDIPLDRHPKPLNGGSPLVGTWHAGNPEALFAACRGGRTCRRLSAVTRRAHRPCAPGRWPPSMWPASRWLASP